MKFNYELFLVHRDFTIKQAMKRMTEIGQKILFVVDDKKVLAGALSDGDIRNWILSGGSIKESVEKIYNRKPKFVRVDFKPSEAKKLMLDFLIESVPVVDDDNKVVRVLTWEIFSGKRPIRSSPLDIQVVIMAGGRGTRLDPFTRILPKALIPIGDKPIIEIIMDRFYEYGIKEFFVTVNHKSKMIKSYFEDTGNDKYKIQYIAETKPLGTAGSLKYLRGKIKEPFFITNCDTIVDMDYGEIVNFHKENNNDMTLVASYKHHAIPYGVCEIENGGMLKSIKEKPEYDFLANTGIYVMNRKVLGLIPADTAFDMNHMIERAQKKGYKIGVFPISDRLWIDIGQWEEYHKAIEKLSTEKGIS